MKSFQKKPITATITLSDRALEELGQLKWWQFRKRYRRHKLNKALAIMAKSAGEALANAMNDDQTRKYLESIGEPE